MTAKSKKSTNLDEKIVRMRIICIDPLDYRKYHAIFGVQDAARYVHEGKRQPNGDIHYDIEEGWVVRKDPLL